MKEKMMRALGKLGKKCRPLAYPVLVIMVFFVSVYHTCRKVLLNMGRQRLRTRILSGALAAALVLTLVVWPSMAEEQSGEPVMEVVDETEEPESSLEETEEPEEAEEAEEAESSAESEEPADSAEAEETAEPKETEELAGDTDKSEEVMSPSEAGESGDAGQGKPAAGTETDSSKRAVKAAEPKAARAIQAPQIIEQPHAETSGYTYGQLPGPIELKIQAKTAEDGDKISYQWYLKKNGSETAISGEAGTKNRYTIAKDIDAGTYTYYCKVTSTDIEDAENTASTDSDEVTIEIFKAQPKFADFRYQFPTQSGYTQTIPSLLYYTGKVQPVSVRAADGVRGMGNAAFRFYNTKEDPDSATDLKNTGDYKLKLYVEEGTNYEAATLEVTERVLIERINTPPKAYSILGTRGNANNEKGGYWYISQVTIYPGSSTLEIGLTEEDFSDKIEIDTEGENVQPEYVYLRYKGTGYITNPVPITDKDKIHIDTVKPEGEISFDKTGNTSVKVPDCVFFNSEVTVNITGRDDNGSGVRDIYYYQSNKQISDSSLPNVPWVKGETFKLDKDGRFIVYARIRDKAGHSTYISKTVVIDRKEPVITCDGDVPKESYIADKKHFTATDDNLKEVRIYNGSNADGAVQNTYEAEGNTAEFNLKLPGSESAEATYTIVAEDLAGNKKQTTVKLVNPNTEVVVTDLEFTNGGVKAVYGYPAIGAEVIKCSPKEESPVPIEIYSIEIEEGQDYFEIVSNNSKNGFTVRPKRGLHVGKYDGIIRINYNKEFGSTTTCKCSFEVEAATLTARYTGSTVYYHTIPDFSGTIQVTGFVNGDTVEKLLKEGTYTAPVISYVESGGAPKRALEDEESLQPQGGSASDYTFQYVSGKMTVVRRALPNYQILGTKGKNGWYTSDIALLPEAGYQISETDTGSSFGDTGLSVTEETAEEIKSFYLMDTVTGEISTQMTETFKLDKTGPVFAGGEGINISTDLWNSFMNSVTFGMYFNDTKAVSISGSDDISGVDSIQYHISANSLAEATVKTLPENVWTNYSSSFTLSPSEVKDVVIYARITNGAGLKTYISSNGMVFDDKAPDIVEVVDGKEYITEQKVIEVYDRNLREVTLYEGQETFGQGTTQATSGSSVVLTIDCPASGSKDYTILALDAAGNMTEKTFTITHPIYDIEADVLEIDTTPYGYTIDPAARVTWVNTKASNAPAVVREVEISDKKHFSVKENQGAFFIVAKQGLPVGEYETEVTLSYGDGQTAETTCYFTVEKAVLTVRYTGQEVYYHTTPDFDDTVTVTGFVNGETAQTAEGYEAPHISFYGEATKTTVLTPSGGKADNYTFAYNSGVLTVRRRTAERGKNGQYTIRGTLSDTGWYTSDITIEPNSGFGIVFDEEMDSIEQIVLKKDTDAGEQRFYIVNEKTSEIYEETVFDYRKDSVEPVIRGITDGGEYKANSQKVTVEDDYLSNITVNGVAQEVSQGQSTFALSADQTNTVYVLMATDRAGNTSTASVVMQQPDSIPGDEEEEEDGIESPGGTSEPGTVKKKVRVIAGAPATVLTTSTDKLASSVLTDGEQKAVNKGSNANIELRIRNIDNSVSQKDKEKIIANLGSYVAGEYLDITLWKTVGSSEAKKVHNTEKPISITVTIPAQLRNTDSSRERSYAIFRVHNGAVTVLQDQDSVENTVTFATDKFSTYVLAYRDTRKGSGSGTGQSHSTIGGAGPETGDNAPILPVTVVFVLSLVGIATVMTVGKKRN
ncbi:MAG: hypothetical protein J1F02_10360 [Lachnospiraceae bacterium]|nr:hypothetical protein [Lachnospiraceae bacterium]